MVIMIEIPATKRSHRWPNCPGSVLHPPASWPRCRSPGGHGIPGMAHGKPPRLSQGGFHRSQHCRQERRLHSGTFEDLTYLATTCIRLRRTPLRSQSNCPSNQPSMGLSTPATRSSCTSSQTAFACAYAGTGAYVSGVHQGLQQPGTNGGGRDNVTEMRVPHWPQGRYWRRFHHPHPRPDILVQGPHHRDPRCYSRYLCLDESGSSAARTSSPPYALISVSGPPAG